MFNSYDLTDPRDQENIKGSEEEKMQIDTDLIVVLIAIFPGLISLIWTISQERRINKMCASCPFYLNSRPIRQPTSDDLGNPKPIKTREIKTTLENIQKIDARQT